MQTNAKAVVSVTSSMDAMLSSLFLLIPACHGTQDNIISRYRPHLTPAQPIS